MRLLDFLKRKKETQTKKNVTLVSKNERSVVLSTPKKKKIHNLVDFIKDALTSNGGNYNDIHQKLLTISNFAKSAKKYGVNCDLTRINETLQDFFTPQKDIKFNPFKDIPFMAFYTKKDGLNFYNYRGVTVIQDEQSKKPIMYFGRRNKNAETHRKDTAFWFGENAVILMDEWHANYDEIPLFGNGTYAEFTFDDDNKITKIVFRYITDSKLGFWSEEQVCEFDSETKQYILLL